MTTASTKGSRLHADQGPAPIDMLQEADIRVHPKHWQRRAINGLMQCSRQDRFSIAAGMVGTKGFPPVEGPYSLRKEDRALHRQRNDRADTFRPFFSNAAGPRTIGHEEAAGAALPGDRARRGVKRTSDASALFRSVSAVGNRDHSLSVARQS